MDSTRNYNYDAVRATAIIFVVMMHSCGRLAEAQDVFAFRALNVVLCSVINTAVPMFLMLSGTLLLGRAEPLKVFFKKRISRILLPFLVWSVIFYLLRFPPQGLGCIPDYFSKLFCGGIHGVFWFVYTIIGLYLLTPLLRPAFSLRGVAIWVLGLSLVLFLVHQFLPGKIPLAEGIWFPDVRHFMCYAGGFVLVNQLGGKRWIRWAAPVWFVAFMSAQIITGLAHPVDFPFYIFSGFGLFMWMTTWKFRRQSKLVTFLSKSSYGIYLCHAAVVSLVVRLTEPYIPVAASPFTTCLLSLAIAAGMMWVFTKLKIGRLFL